MRDFLFFWQVFWPRITNCSGGLKPATGDLAILLIADDAVPAAERLKNVAPGASPGYACRKTPSPGRGERLCAVSFAPTGLSSTQHEPRACARGYVLKPLRGSFRLISNSSRSGVNSPRYRRA